MCETWRNLYKKLELLTLCQHRNPVAHRFSLDFCFWFFVVACLMLFCVMSPVLHVFLDCPFVIAPSVFSLVYSNLDTYVNMVKYNSFKSPTHELVFHWSVSIPLSLVVTVATNGFKRQYATITVLKVRFYSQVLVTFADFDLLTLLLPKCAKLFGFLIFRL
jgi:hypothetical protein